jgi:hypothetical protein
MVIVILKNKRGGLEVLEVSPEDWDTMKTALEWKNRGNWEKVKRFVYKNKLHKKKPRYIL